MSSLNALPAELTDPGVSAGFRESGVLSSVLESVFIPPRVFLIFNLSVSICCVSCDYYFFYTSFVIFLVYMLYASGAPGYTVNGFWQPGVRLLTRKENP